MPPPQGRKGYITDATVGKGILPRGLRGALRGRGKEKGMDFYKKAAPPAPFGDWRDGVKPGDAVTLRVVRGSRGTLKNGSTGEVHRYRAVVEAVTKHFVVCMLEPGRYRECFFWSDFAQRAV